MTDVGSTKGSVIEAARHELGVGVRAFRARPSNRRKRAVGRRTFGRQLVSSKIFIVDTSGANRRRCCELGGSIMARHRLRIERMTPGRARQRICGCKPSATSARVCVGRANLLPNPTLHASSRWPAQAFAISLALLVQARSCGAIFVLRTEQHLGVNSENIASCWTNCSVRSTIVTLKPCDASSCNLPLRPRSRSPFESLNYQLKSGAITGYVCVILAGRIGRSSKVVRRDGGCR